jgi:oxalate decarboxylase
MLTSEKGPAMTTTYSRHAASLTDGEVVEQSDLGSITRITADTFPILKGLSGTSLVSVLDTGSVFSSFTVTAGDMFHIDSGSLHHIENIGGDVAEFIIAFRDERREDFGFGATFGAMTDAVLGNTYDLDASDFAAIRRDTADRALMARQGEAPPGWRECSSGRR